MMKKHPKARQFALSAVASALLTMPAMAENVNISQAPLIGVSKLTPAVVLALSVEYPTSGSAYNATNALGLDDLKKTYMGYFDNTKCYTYIQTIAHGDGGYKRQVQSGGGSVALNDNNYYDYPRTIWPGDGTGMYGVKGSQQVSNGWIIKYGDGYFAPTSNAATSSEGYKGLCAGENEWSGNALNFLTMSSLDIVRKTLTGGNRAKGVGADPQVYSDGDGGSGDGKYYLRRAMMWSGIEYRDGLVDNKWQNQINDSSRARSFHKDIYTTDITAGGSTKKALSFLVPDAYLTGMQELNNANKADRKSAFFRSKNYPFNAHKENDQITNNDKVVDALVFWNTGTGFLLHYYANAFSGNKFKSKFRNNDSDLSWYVPTSTQWYNVVVQQESQPTGLLQEDDYQGMKLASMGYLVEPKSGGSYAERNAIDGGILTGKMTVARDFFAAGGKFKTEQNALTYLNQFGDDIPYDNYDAVAELYYTAVRYLRHGAWEDGATEPTSSTQGNPYSVSSTAKYRTGKFNAITDWDDPLHPTGTELADGACHTPAIILLGDTNSHADNNIPNYPTSKIKDNVALEKDGTNSYQKVYKLQGTTYDGTNFKGEKDYRLSAGAQYYEDSDAIKAADYSPAFGLAGMAYWVHTNDIRPDIQAAVKAKGNETNPMYIQNFFIDVFEEGYPKNYPSTVTNWGEFDKHNTSPKDVDTDGTKVLNSYYLAGKFGGFTFSSGNPEADVQNRASWLGSGISPTWNGKDLYGDGMPANFAIAENPENMSKALVDAFKTVGITKNTMQSGIQYNNGNGAELNLSAKGSANLVAQGYIKAIKEIKDGKEVITGYTVTNKAKVLEELQKNPKLVPLTFRAGYNTTNWTGYLKASVLVTAYQEGDAYGSAPMEAELWDAGTILSGKYHKSPVPARKVESKAENTASTPNSGFVEFDVAHESSLDEYITGAVIETTTRDNNGNKTGGTNYYNQLSSPSKSPANLINYLLGDSTYEGDGGFRVRSGSLMGTSVYSSVTPILQNNTTQEVRGVPIDGGKTCRYDKARSGDYVATASNEGMLHIFDMEGYEKYAYVPQTALPYIANFASPNYEHRYVNDGTAVLHEVCDGTHAATYLVGTSGRGGSSIYAINVTDDTNFKAALEVNADTDSDIGILVSAPIVANQAVTGGSGDPVIIFSSGYNNPSGNGHLFIYNLKTGSRIAKIPLGSSGVGSPTGYDSNNDGIIDRIYVGDYAGKLYRISMTDPVGANATWGSCDGGKQCVKEVFTAEGPILNRPAIGQVGNKTAILLGTGTYLHLNDMMNTKQNYAYGIFDDGTAENIATGDLLTQTFTENKQAGSNGNENLTFYEITQNKDEKDEKKGWRLVLPKGYTVTSDSAFYGPHNEVAIYTATKAEEGVCGVTGDTMLLAVDSRNGGAYERPIFDVNNDYKFNDSDAPNGYTIGAVSTGFVGLGGGIANTNLPVNLFRVTSGPQTAQAAVYKFPSGALRTRRVSWREVF